MTDLRKAAEQALEALEEAASCVQHSYLPDSMGHDWDEQIEALRQALAEPANSTTDFVEPKALPQTEQEPLGSEWVPCVKLPVIVHVRNQRGGENHISTREGITPVLPEDLIMRGVAGEEYPIGRELFERTYTFDVDAVNMSQERVDETAKGEHEPVCFLRETSWSYEIAAWNDPRGFPVYAAPPKQEYQYEVVAEHADGTYTTRRIPKREWVGLTDDEIYDYADKFLYQHGSNYGIRSFGKAIEAKLKEKNT